MGKPFPGPWSFAHHPWSKAIHDCESDLIIGQKAAQMAFTEVALNKTFKKIDIDGISVLYVLPAASPDASDFSSSRFDPALEMSPHLRRLFSDVKNVGHKRAGNANLFIRGSRSRSQLKSVPVGFMVFDEFDEMCQENIPLAFERMSGQEDKQAFIISTPTVSGVGIANYFDDSTQDHFMFRCPHCSKMTELVYPDCLVITAETIYDPAINASHLICRECKAALDHKTKSTWLTLDNTEWVSSYTNRPIRGFTIPQLYSMTVDPVDIAKLVIKSHTDPFSEQEFWNSKLGQPHAVKGARISDEDIKNCVGEYKSYNSAPDNSLCTMGIDVGKTLHVWIDQWFSSSADVASTDMNLTSTPRTLAVIEVLEFSNLSTLVKAFRPRAIVIDMHPERRKALEFANLYYGLVKMCVYSDGVSGKNIFLHKEEEHRLDVDRTSWMDLALGRFSRNKISLPFDLPINVGQHLKSPVKIYTVDRNGNSIARFLKSEKDADHFAHARTYSEIAFAVAVGSATVKDAKGIV
jgi:hypothetical protein